MILRKNSCCKFFVDYVSCDDQGFIVPFHNIIYQRIIYRQEKLWLIGTGFIVIVITNLAHTIAEIQRK